MDLMNRRGFIGKSAAASASLMVGMPLLQNSYGKPSPNDMVNIAVIGIRSRGKDHYKALAKVPNLRIAMLCDIDERLLPEAVAEVEKLTGFKPKTETDFRKVLENKDIHCISVATPNHWHALITIMACQAGKDVYVEKPVSHTILEGRRMVEAARKYGRVVQTGTQSRSNLLIKKALKFVADDGLGSIHMTKGLCIKPRGNIGHVKDSAIPEGVNWDMFLGPAPYRPFNENRFHYKWHWFWDTGCADMGNQGIHQADVARWAMDVHTHPVKIHGVGKYFQYDSDQETPNVQQLSFEYKDGRILQFDVNGLACNSSGDLKIGTLVYGSKGWLSVENEDSGKTQVHLGEVSIRPSGGSGYKESNGPAFGYEAGEEKDAVYLHFQNFIDCVRTRRWQDLNADILEGHISTSLCHLGNIACRVGRSLEFNPSAEKFINDEEANGYLTKMYRAPFVLPDNV
jgi:predicted dehydrogenase